jgi:hypothetical protein
VAVIILGIVVFVDEVAPRHQFRGQVFVIGIRSAVEHCKNQVAAGGDVPSFRCIDVVTAGLLETPLIDEPRIVGNRRPTLADPVRFGEIDPGNSRPRDDLGWVRKAERTRRMSPPFARASPESVSRTVRGTPRRVDGI